MNFGDLFVNEDVWIADADLQEAARKSLGRVAQHMSGDRGFGYISAQRSADKDGKPYTAADHNRRFKELKSNLKAGGYSYIPSKGSYPEEQSDGSTKTAHEKSLMVFAKHKGDDGGDLHKALSAQADHFDQDTFIHKPFGGKTANIHAMKDLDYLDMKKGEARDIGGFHANRVGPFGHTTLTKGSTTPAKKGKTSPGQRVFVFAKSKEDTLKPAN